MLLASLPLAPIAAASPTLIAALIFLRIRGADSQTTVGISCWGVGNDFEYVNNTRCPGSNVCCGFDATCLSNGLCHGTNDPEDIFVRGPCAIKPYDKETCAKICVYDEAVEGNFLPRVRICDNDGSYCCSNDESCCVQGRGVFLDEEGNIAESAASTTYSYGPERTDATFQYTAPSLLQSATADPESATTATTTEPSPTATESDGDAGPTGAAEEDGGSGGAGLGLKIGLGLGIPLAAIVAGTAVWFFMRRRGRKDDDGPLDGPATAQAPQSMAGDSYASGGSPHAGLYPGNGGWKSSPGSYMTPTTNGRHGQDKYELVSYPSELGVSRAPVEMSA